MYMYMYMYIYIYIYIYIIYYIFELILNNDKKRRESYKYILFLLYQHMSKWMTPKITKDCIISSNNTK